MRFDAPHLHVERLVGLASEALEQPDRVVGRLLGARAALEVLQPASLRADMRLVDDADARRRVASVAQNLAQVSLVRMQVPGEIRVAQPHHAVAVRIPAREDRRP